MLDEHVSISHEFPHDFMRLFSVQSYAVSKFEGVNEITSGREQRPSPNVIQAKLRPGFDSSAKRIKHQNRRLLRDHSPHRETLDDVSRRSLSVLGRNVNTIWNRMNLRLAHAKRNQARTRGVTHGDDAVTLVIAQVFRSP